MKEWQDHLPDSEMRKEVNVSLATGKVIQIHTICDCTVGTRHHRNTFKENTTHTLIFYIILLIIHTFIIGDVYK